MCRYCYNYRMIDTNSYCTEKEITELGLKNVGRNVKISKHVNFYGAQYISIGSNVRIDDFCILSASREGSFSVGDNVHIGAGVYLFGTYGIQIGDFSGLSSGVKVYSTSDDYSGEFLTNPTVSREFLNSRNELVIIEKHALIGAGSVVLPGVVISEGVAVGALSLVSKSLDSWSIYAGQPVRKIKDRSKNLLKLEAKLLKSESKPGAT
jgi:acetyltransferase-like isoleucine patch superfamily enzyme